MGEKGAIVDAFVDRIEELAALEEQFADHQAAMVVIYGRRRIGKTALITEFVRDKRALYFLATEESEEQNRAAFQKQVAAFTGASSSRWTSSSTSARRTRRSPPSSSASGTRCFPSAT